MDYTTRIVRSVEGLTQEEALVTLQEHPSFKPGTRVASIQNQEGRWVAKLLEPKTAGEEELDELTEKDEKKAEPKLDSEDKHEHDEHEKAETPLEEIKEHNAEKDEHDEDSDDKKIKDLEKKIDKLLDALGIAEDVVEGIAEGSASDNPAPVPPAGAAAPVPPMGPAGPKGGAPKGPELPPGSGAKLKPGEVPNKPGVTPIGSPAFASVKQANPMAAPSGATSTPAVAPTQQCTCGGVGTCAPCKAKQSVSPSGSQPTAPAPVAAPGAAQKTTSFVASRLDSNRDLSIRQAKLSLENDFAAHGFRVARLKRDGDYLRALMVENDS
jgi:hypothetical protein